MRVGFEFNLTSTSILLVCEVIVVFVSLVGTCRHAAERSASGCEVQVSSPPPWRSPSYPSSLFVCRMLALLLHDAAALGLWVLQGFAGASEMLVRSKRILCESQVVLLACFMEFLSNSGSYYECQCADDGLPAQSQISSNAFR